MRLVLFEPDIPQNAGALIRLAACFGVALDVIEPCGFDLGDRRLRRAGMDYLERTSVTRHASWQAYQAAPHAGRLVLLTTAGALSHVAFAFAPDDRLMVGRETAGVPDAVHDAAAARLRIPIRPGTRSLNVACAAAIALGEALRQTAMLPGMLPGPAAP